MVGLAGCEPFGGMGQPKVRYDVLFWTDESVGIGMVDLETGETAGLYAPTTV